MKFPFEIPGYGEIVDENAFELFKTHYLYLAKTVHNQRIEASKKTYPINVVIQVTNGVVEYVYSDAPEDILVTLVDNDNIREGDIIITQGEYGVDIIDEDFENFIQKISDEDVFVFLHGPNCSKEYEEK